jgi:hypothetical protein
MNGSRAAAAAVRSRPRSSSSRPATGLAATAAEPAGADRPLAAAVPADLATPGRNR